MHKVTFFPLGNADCCRIDLANGQKLLIDFAATCDPDDDDDLRCNLPELLKEDLENADRDFFDVVAISHLDKDHYCGATEFFWLEHAKKYQGEGRIKISTLWVPATIITEESCEEDEAKIIQAEARHRFKEGKGIRVFSRPDRLKDWCKDNDVPLEERTHLITDAGQLIPGFTLDSEGVEFFVHSPFAKRLNDTEVEDRNEDSLVFQATFRVDKVDTRLLMLADTPHENLSEIVTITRDVKKRPERLAWDIAKLAHHCSYLSLGPEKGKDKTQPTKETGWLWASQGQQKAVIVSTSKPIPEKDSDEDTDPNPPHRQAANYYREVTAAIDGEFAVTMEHPNASKPAPMIFEISSSKSTLKKPTKAAASVAATSRPPRAG